MHDLDKKILEELVYERVRLSINLCQLVIFEQDLDKSIDRAMGPGVGNAEAHAALSRTYIDRAWQRVQAEWQRMRSDLGDDD